MSDIDMAGDTYREMMGARVRMDMKALRDDSEELERFRRREFGTLRAHLEGVVAESASVRIFPLPLVHRVTRDLARHYVRRPTRTWSSAQDGMDEWYRRIGVDRAMLDVHQRLVAHQSQIMTVLPGARGPEVRAWSPYEAEVVLDSPLTRDIRDAREVRLRAPVAMADGDALEGRWVLTRDTAYEERPDGTRVGLWDRNDPGNLRHPLGYVPAVGVRVHEGMGGQWFPAIAEDLLQVQIGLCVALSDVIHSAGAASTGQPVLKGPGAGTIARELDWSPLKAWVIDTHGAGASASEITLEVVTSNPPVEKYLAAIERTLVLVASMNYLDLSVAGLPSIVTGAAVREIRQAQTDEMERWSLLLESAEQDLAAVLGDVSRGDPTRLAAMPRQAHLVDVSYHLVEGPRTLQDVQAVEAAMRLGLDSAAEAVSRTDGIPLTEAADRVTRRLEAWREMLAQASDQAAQ